MNPVYVIQECLHGYWVDVEEHNAFDSYAPAKELKDILNLNSEREFRIVKRTDEVME